MRPFKGVAGTSTSIGSDNFFDFNKFPSYSKLERGSFHLLPDYGTILPSTGATFCHCRAQSDASGEKFREVYHRYLRSKGQNFCKWGSPLGRHTLGRG